MVPSTQSFQSPCMKSMRG